MLIVVMVLSISFTLFAYCLEQSEESDATYELYYMSAGIDSADGANAGNSNLHFFQDEIGIIWMFDVLDSGDVELIGSFFGYCSGCNDGVLKVPGMVQDNISLDDPVIIGSNVTFSFSSPNSNGSYTVSRLSNGTISPLNDPSSAPIVSAFESNIRKSLKDLPYNCNISFKNSLIENRNLFTELVIPNAVKSVGVSALNGLPNIAKISFAEGSVLSTIGSTAFSVGKEPSDTSSMIKVGNNGEMSNDQFVNICNQFVNTDGVTVLVKDKLVITRDALESSKIFYELDGNNGLRSSACYESPDGEYDDLSLGNGIEINKSGIIWLYENETEDSSYLCLNVVFENQIYCGITTTIPDSVVSIGRAAFPYVVDLTIGAGSNLEKVGEAAFKTLQNDTITLPSGIKEIHKDSFNTAKLVFKGNDIIDENGNVLKKLSENQFELLWYSGSDSVYSLPDKVISVADKAFSGYKFEKFTLKSGVIWGQYLFDGGSISSIDFNRINEIPYAIFGNCTMPETLCIPNYVEEIGDLAFVKCSGLKNLIFEEETKISVIGNYSFANCKDLERVEFKKAYMDTSCIISEGAFIGYNSLNDVIIDEQFVLTSIGDYAFTKRYVEPTPLTPIKFNSSSEYDILIPSDVVFVGKFAFSGIDNNTFDDIYPKQNPTCSTPQTSGFSISFEENSMLITLSQNSFAISNLTKVDLSNCSKVESIIGFTTPKQLVLPTGDNLTSIALVSVVPAKDVELQTICIPKSVRSLSGLVYQNVSFEKDSKLETVVCSGEMDLSECRSLKSVTLGGIITLPDGVYSIIKPSTAGFKIDDCVKNSSGIVVDATGGGISIDSSIHAINKDLLGSVEVTGGNDIIWIEDGMVCSIWSGKRTAFGVSAPSISEIQITNDSTIERVESGSFSNDVNHKVLKIGKELEYGDSIFGQPTTPMYSMEFSKKNYAMSYTKVTVDYVQGKWIVTGYTADGSEINISNPIQYVNVDAVQVEFGSGVARVVSGSNTIGWKDIAIEEGGNHVVLREHGAVGTYIILNCFATAIPEADVFLGEGLAFPSNAFSNSGDTRFTFNVIGDSVVENALELGSVRIGRIIDDKTVYIPYDMDGMRVHIGKVEQSENNILFGASIDGGYTFYDTDVTGVQGITVQDANTISIPSGTDSVIVLSITPKDRSNGECRVTFQSDSSNAISAIYIPKGMTILDSEIPVAVKDNYVFKGWMYGGSVYDFDTPVVRNIILIASWLERNSIVSVVTPAGDVTINGEHTSVLEISKDTATATIGITVYEGYEFLGWTYVQSDKVQTYEGSTLTLQNIDSDVTVSVDYRYYSTSSGLVPIVNRGFPTSDEITSAVKSWSAGGMMNMSGMNWTGHSSVPLIVDDYVYLRIGDKLCKVESDTGYCVASVPSVSQTTFYHQLGYGNGLIIDYATNKVYDAGLELRFILDRTITGAEYHNGMFYTSGDDLYRFPADSSKAVNGTMHLEFVGTFDKKIYSSYGFSSGIFHNDTLYRVSADGSSRGIAWMKLDGSGHGYTELTELSNMYMDDGWMSLNGDILYIGGYTEGLFGSVARSGYSTMAYMRINSDSSISDVNYIVFNGTAGTVKSSGFISEFVVCNGIGFVNVNSKLYAYRMNDDGTPKEIMASGDLSFGHGSFVIDSSHSSEKGNPLYVYMIPYRSGGGASTMAVMKCFLSGTDYVMKPVQAYNFESNYNSQALRAGLDGQMIWYNDSGWVYSYANPEDNRYFLFIRDGDSGRWYESTGGSAYAAFSKLGSDVLTFGKMKNLSTVNGRSAMDFSMYVVKYGDVSLKTYATPTQVFDLRDSANDVYHYYIITSESGALAEGGSWSYIDDSMELKTYAFKFNIGDRSLVGKNMALAGKESVVTFYDGKTVVGKDMGAIGSKIYDLSYPNIVKEGLFVNWKLESDDKTFQKPEYRVDAEWISTIKEVSVSKSDDMYTVVAKLDRVDGITDPNVAFVAKYDDMVFWEFVSITSWGDEDSFVFKTSVLFDGLTSATLMFVDGSNYRDCVMVAIAECGLAV